MCMYTEFAYIRHKYGTVTMMGHLHRSFIWEQFVEYVSQCKLIQGPLCTEESAITVFGRNGFGPDCMHPKQGEDNNDTPIRKTGAADSNSNCVSKHIVHIAI